MMKLYKNIYKKRILDQGCTTKYILPGTQVSVTLKKYPAPDSKKVSVRRPYRVVKEYICTPFICRND